MTHLRPCSAHALLVLDPLPTEPGEKFWPSAEEFLALGLIDCMCSMYTAVPFDAARVEPGDEIRHPRHGGIRTVLTRHRSRSIVYFTLSEGDSLVAIRQSTIYVYEHDC